MENVRQFHAKFFSWARGRKQIQPPNLDVSRPNTLGGLVAELLLSIADFLSPEDIYCLSLCSHRLFATFESWRERKQLGNESRLSFLSRLAQDDRHYFTCYVCYVLHRFDCGSKSSGLLGPSHQEMSQSKLPCARMGDWQSIPQLTMCIHSKKNYHHTHHTFCFLHLQLAMRRYYYGSRYGLSASALSFTEVNRYTASTALCSLEARVCRDLLPVLCLRIQNIMSVSGLAKRLLSDKDRQVPLQIYQICAHIGHAELLPTIKDFVDAHHRRDTLSLLRTTCDECNTEYQLELRVYGNRNIALMITRWINLGTGRSPDDPQWKVHSLASQHAPPILRPSNMMVSPRILFEASPTRTFEEFCTQNLHYLTGRTYESEMTRLSGSLPSWG